MKHGPVGRCVWWRCDGCYLFVGLRSRIPAPHRPELNADDDDGNKDHAPHGLATLHAHREAQRQPRNTNRIHVSLMVVRQARRQNGGGRGERECTRDEPEPADCGRGVQSTASRLAGRKKMSHAPTARPARNSLLPSGLHDSAKKAALRLPWSAESSSRLRMNPQRPGRKHDHRNRNCANADIRGLLPERRTKQQSGHRRQVRTEPREDPRGNRNGEGTRGKTRGDQRDGDGHGPSGLDAVCRLIQTSRYQYRARQDALAPSPSRALRASHHNATTSAARPMALASRSAARGRNPVEQRGQEQHIGRRRHAGQRRAAVLRIAARDDTLSAVERDESVVEPGQRWRAEP